MGERDPGLAPAAAAPPWAQRGLLAAALAVLALVVLVAPPTRPPTELAPQGLVTRLLEVAATGAVSGRGPAVVGLLMLALAAAAVCRPLERRIGATAPLLVTLLIFGSACWALVWSTGQALAPLALATIALALAYGGDGATGEPARIYRPREPTGRAAARCLVAGLLLAELVPTSPLLAGLLLPAARAVTPQRRRFCVPLLLAGFAVGLAVELAVQGPRMMTAPAQLVVESLRLDPALAGRSLLAMLVGRNVGLLAGFAPLPLLLLLGRGDGSRPGLAGVCLALPVIGALLLPFDFAAGWLNLSFLPLYGALWHLPVRPPRRWEWVLAMLLCGAATWPLWSAPREAVADQGVRLAAARPRADLPYEMTLRSLPNRGTGRLPGGVRARAVAGCGYSAEANRFEMEGDTTCTIWLATPADLELVALEFGPGAPSTMELSGATAGRTVFRPDGRVGFEVLLSRPRAVHQLWFGDRPLATYLLEVRLPGRQDGRALRFRLLAAPQPSPPAAAKRATDE